MAVSAFSVLHRVDVVSTMSALAAPRESLPVGFTSLDDRDVLGSYS